MAEFTQRLARLWCVQVPRASSRVSRGLAFGLADGHFLSAVPAMAAWGPPLIATIGLVCGAFSLGYDRVFTESLVLVLIATLAGFLATNLGIAFTVGFAIGDLLFGQPYFGTYYIFGRGYFLLVTSQLIGYLLLAGVAVYLPRLARALMADIPKTERLPRKVAFAVSAIMNLVLVAVGTRLWAEASAVLVRPLFTWQSRGPAVDAVVTLQKQAVWIVGAAFLATIVRFALLWWIYGNETRTRTLTEVETQLADESKITPLLERPGPVVTSVAVAGFTTLLLAGTIQSWWVAGLMFSVFFLLRLLRLGVIPPRLNGWKRLVARVPMLIRLAIAIVVVDTIRRVFVGESAPSFDWIAIYVVGAVMILYLLLPGSPDERER